MNELVEGIGTATEGGLFARVLEPGTGAKERDPHAPDKCLNCGTTLVGAYCHACGQAGHLHRTIGGFVHDLLHGALHFEGKMWRTLPLLAIRPGWLTRRYVEGARARFVSPMALFLFSVFLMFAIFQAVGITAPTEIGNSADGDEAVSVVQSEAETSGAEMADEIETLEAEIAALPEDAPQRASLEQELRVLEQASDGLARVAENGLPNLNINTGSTWLDENIGKKWNENPGLMLYKLQANSYKFSWLLIPISVPFVWLLFLWRRGFKGYDHAIFVTYSLSFMTLLFVTVSLLQVIGTPWAILALLIFLVPPIHLYKQLRGAYSLSRFSAFWRLMALSMFIWVVIGLFIQILLVLGAF